MNMVVGKVGWRGHEYGCGQRCRNGGGGGMGGIYPPPNNWTPSPPIITKCIPQYFKFAKFVKR